MNGYCKLKKDPKGENFKIENLLLRGSTTRNCEWWDNFLLTNFIQRIFGLILYAGNETKLMMNRLS